MGQSVSLPRAGSQLQVIGAGLPRSGTTSLTEALTILLDGPVFHGGSQMLLREEAVVKSWIKLLEETASPEKPDLVAMDVLKSNLDGFVATTDSPGGLFVPELLELYPDAKVVCSIREKDLWVNSVVRMTDSAMPWYVIWAVKPLPSVRLFHPYLYAVWKKRWFNLNRHKDGPKANKFLDNPRRNYEMTYDLHHRLLRENIPEDRILFFDVKDGWEPLCKFLGCPVPVGVKFPHKNEGAQMERFIQQQVVRGAKIWLMACSGMTVFCAMALTRLFRRW